MSNGQGFEFTPMGIIPLGTAAGVLEGLAGATADVPPPDDEPRYSIEPRRPGKAAAAKPAMPLDVIKLARARLREVEREIKRLRKLEVERDELKRLLDAATRKPIASVRSLPTRSA